MTTCCGLLEDKSRHWCEIHHYSIALYHLVQQVNHQRDLWDVTGWLTLFGPLVPQVLCFLYFSGICVECATSTPSKSVKLIADTLFLSLKESQDWWMCWPLSFSHASLCSTSLMVASQNCIPSGTLNRTSPLTQLCGLADMTTGRCLELWSIPQSHSLSLIHLPNHALYMLG